MEKILSFDSGTTNTKVFIYTKDGRLLESISTKNRISFPYPLFAEQDSKEWTDSLKRCISQIKDKKEICGVSGSFQGGTFVVLDRNNLPLSSGITWLDNRAKDIAKSIVKKYGEDFFYKKTGYVPGGWSSLAILLWLRENQPEIFKKISRISFVSDYINHYLTGNFVLDHTSAAITTLYNIKKRNWDEEILEIAGIKKQMLPEIIESSEVAGHMKNSVSKYLGLSSGIPVLAGGHDQYCASLGAGASEKGRILVSCGTAWVLLLTAEKVIFDPLKQFAPGPYVKKGFYGLMAAISNGGVVFAWAKDSLKQKPFTFTKPSNIIVIPEFNTGNGAICGLGLSTRPSEIMQAVVESLCFQVRERLERMEKIIGKNEKIKLIVMIGGPATQMWVGRLLASITGKMVFVPEISEAAGLGAMKLFSSFYELKDTKKGTLIKPDRSLCESYDNLYKRYMSLKKKLL